MKYSALFGKTRREAPKDEVSTNAKLLIRGGFIEKLGAGIYNFLPLGWRVHQKIAQIVREEINAIGGQELNLAALHPKSFWEKSGRWSNFNALFKFASKNSQGEDYALGATHEEILTPTVAQFISSYKDLPLYLYQIQVKFRDEARAKSGLLRGREFVMKDLYSFHATEEDRAKYYETVRGAYEKIFKRLDLKAIYTKASGGSFSEFSHEFQVVTEAGEDQVMYCPSGDFAENLEIATVKPGKECDLGHGPLVVAKSIEAGNIFPLGTKFSEAFGAYFTDETGNKKPIIMGSYGIGIGRSMGAIVEIHNDEKGIIWPESVAPYQVHLVGLNSKAEKVYQTLEKAGVEVLFDDRDVSAGQKFADADLIGIPVRLVVSDKTHSASSGQAGEKIEFKKRNEEKTELISIEELLKRTT